MTQAVRGVLFDLDGTLLDTHDLLLESFRYTTRQVLGRTIPDNLLMAKVGQPLNTQMWDFAADEAEHDELCRVYRDYNKRIHDQRIKSFPGTEQALKELRAAGLPLGVVTSKRHEPALHGLDTFGLASYFDFVVGSDDFPAHKPDPGPVAHGCGLMGLPPQACVYVGDSPFDMQAGNGAGCVTVAATWGMFPADVLAAENPAFTCTDIRDFPALIDRLR